MLEDEDMVLSPDVWRRRGDERYGEHDRQGSKPRQDRHGAHHRPGGHQGQGPSPISYDERGGRPHAFMLPMRRTIPRWDLATSTWALDGGARAG